MEPNSTMVYGRFKFWKSIRTISKNAVNSLKRSIVERDLTSACPILVNPNFYIIDGQHRFEACKELGLPIYYTMVQIGDFEINDYVQVLNSRQRNWGLADFLHYYCELGYKNYLGLRNFMRFHRLHDAYIGAAMYVYSGMMSGGSYTRRFRSGELGDKRPYADDIMANLLSLPIKHNLQRSFVTAFVKAYEDFPRKDFNKLRDNIMMVPALVNVSDYMYTFNNVINMKKRR